MIVRFKIEEEGYRIKRYLIKKGIPDHVFKEIRNARVQIICR